MARLEILPHVEMAISGVFVKQIGPLDDGMTVHQHRHDSPHVTALLAGAVEVTKNGETSRKIAPCLIEVAAHTDHSFKSVAPGTMLYCIHHLGPDEDYPLTWERNDAA